MDNQINIDQIKSELNSIYGDEIGELLPKALEDLGLEPGDWIEEVKYKFFGVAYSPAHFAWDWIVSSDDEIPEKVEDCVEIARDLSADSFDFVSIATGEMIGTDYEELRHCGKCLVFGQM